MAGVGGPVLAAAWKVCQAGRAQRLGRGPEQRRSAAPVYRSVGAACHSRRVAHAVMPEWVVPAFDQVAAVRRSASDAELSELTWVGIARTLDWVAGIEPETPLTLSRDEPTLPRTLAERLCAWELLTGRPAADADYERLGYVPLAPDESLMDRDYASAVGDADMATR